MALNNPRAHHGHVSEYQSSGIPWHQKYNSGANQKVDFPYVTRFVFITATTHDVSVSFDDGGIAAGRFFIIPAGTTSGRLELKCKELHSKFLLCILYLLNHKIIYNLAQNRIVHHSTQYL